MVACLWVRQEAVIQVMEALAQRRAVMETGGLMDLEVQVTVETAVLEAMEAREAMEAETSQTGMVARMAMEVVVMMVILGMTTNGSTEPKRRCQAYPVIHVWVGMCATPAMRGFI